MRLFSLLLTIVFLSSNCFAQIPDMPEFRGHGSPNEYYLSGEGRPLIKVNVISGVRNPGVYHIPIGTNLGELMSYAGGAMPGAELDSIRVTSNSDKKNPLKTYDFFELSKSPKDFPDLANNDYVQINVHEDRLSRTALIVSIVSSVAAVTLGYLSYERNK